MSITGAFPCVDCGADVTALRVRGRMRGLLEADPFHPYTPHRCNPLVLAAARQAAAMERLAETTAERNALRAAMAMPATLPEPAPAAVTYTGRRRLAVVERGPASVAPRPDLMDGLRL